MDDVIQQFKDAIAASDAIELMILDKDLRIVWMNEAIEKECGSLDEFRGKTCYEGLAGDPAPHEDCTVRRALASGKTERSFSCAEGKRYVVVAIPLGDTHVGELIVKIPEEE